MKNVFIGAVKPKLIGSSEMKHKNFTYSKFHKDGSAMKLHTEKLENRGCKFVEGTDTKTPKAFTVDYISKSGYWVFYRFGKDQTKPKFKKGQKFNYRESVGGKGIVQIVKVTPDEHNRHNLNYYDLKGVNFTFSSFSESESDIEKMIEEGDLRKV